MKQFVKQGLIFSLVVFTLLQIIGFSSLYFLRQSSFYKPNFVMNGIDETQFDYIILGSSTGLTTLNSIQIDSITGFKGINLSMDDTSMGTHYLMLAHFLSLGKTTKNCVLTISDFNMDKTNAELSGNDYRFMSLVNRAYVYDYFKTYEKGFIKPLSNSKYLPFLGVGYYNTEIFYPSLLVGFEPQKRNRFDSQGNYMFSGFRDFKDKAFETVVFKVNNPFFEKIKTLCEANDIKLVVYHPPFYNQTSKTNDVIDNFINHSDLLKGKTYFFDDVHVNVKGRKAATKAFAKALKSF